MGGENDESAAKILTIEIDEFSLSGDRKSRAKKFIAICAAISIFLLLLNALIVGCALYSVSKVSIDNIKYIRIEDLCSDQAKLRILLRTRPIIGAGWYHFVFFKTSRLSIVLPDVSAEPVCKLTIPPFDYDLKTLDFREHPIRIDINENVNVQKIIDYLNLKSDRKIQVIVATGVKTMAFILPMSFDRTVYVPLTVEASKSLPNSLLKFDHLEFASKDSKDLSIVTFWRLSHLPDFVYLDAPSMSFALTKKNAADFDPVNIGNVELCNGIVTTESPFIIVKLTLYDEQTEAVVNSLRAVIKKDESVELKLRGKMGISDACKLQRLFNRIASSISLDDLFEYWSKKEKRMISTRHLVDTANRGRPNLQKTNAKVHIKPKVLQSLSSVSTVLQVDTSFLVDQLKFDFLKIHGKIPSIRLSAVLEHGYGRDARNTTIAFIEVQHQGCNDGLVKIDLDFHISHDYLFWMALYRAAPKINAHNDLRHLKRIIIDGTSGYGICSGLMSIFKYHYRYSEQQFGFTDLAWMSQQMNVQPEPIVKHAFDMHLDQSGTDGKIALKINFHEGFVADSNIRLSWESVNTVFRSAGSDLLNISIPPGFLHFAIAPLNTVKRLHNGEVEVSVSLVDSQKGWSEFMEKLKAYEGFIPVTISGKVGHMQDIKLETIIPSLAMVSSLWSQESKNDSIEGKLIGIEGSSFILSYAINKKFSCPKSFNWEAAITATLPPMSIYLCVFSDDLQKSCLAKLHTQHRMYVSLKVIDSIVCDLSTMILEEDDRNPFEMNDSSLRLFKEHAIMHDSLPIYVKIVDYVALFESLDALHTGALYIAPGLVENLDRIDHIIGSIGASLRPDMNLSNMKFDLPKFNTTNALPESSPMLLDIDMYSPSRTKISGDFWLRLPKDTLNMSEARDLRHTIQWGPTELKVFFSEKDYVKVCITEGVVVFRDYQNSRPSFQTTEFKLFFEVSVPSFEHLNSGDLRRISHHLTEHFESHIDLSKEISKKVLRLEARIGEYNSPKEFKWIKSNLHIDTLIQLSVVISRKMRSSKCGPANDWSAVASFEALPKIFSNCTDTVRFPCFFSKPCGQLINEPSTLGPLAVLRLKVLKLVKHHFNTIAKTIGSVINKLAYEKIPVACKASLRLHAPLEIALAINNDIDVLEFFVPDVSLTRTTYISDAANHEFKKETIDEEVISLYMSIPQYYHDIAGLLHPIDFDPLIRMSFDKPPPGEYYYSPLGFTLSNERVRKTNLMSSLLCLAMEESDAGPLPSRLKSEKKNKQLTAPISNESLLELLILGASVPNPSGRISLQMSHPLFAEYKYEEKIFGRARIEPAHFWASQDTPVVVRAQLTKDCFGQCDPHDVESSEGFGRFLAGAALGAPLNTTAFVHISPGLSLSIDFQHPQRQVAVALFDVEGTMKEAGELGVRMLNAMDPVVSGGSRFWKWLQSVFARRREVEDGNQVRGWGERIHKWWAGMWSGDDLLVHPETRGRSHYDLNIPLCFRNEADLEMRLFGLYLNLSFDDTDGYYFSRGSTPQDIRNTMCLAQQDCQPRGLFDKDFFLNCIQSHPSGPAATLHRRSIHSKSVMTPISLSAKFLAGFVDEAFNHDGPCLRISDSLISVGFSNGTDAQFTMNIPLNLWVDPHVNAFGDACGVKTECTVNGQAASVHSDTIHLGSRQHRQQHWLSSTVPLTASWSLDFQLELSKHKRNSGFAFVLQQNAANVTIDGDALWGYHVGNHARGPVHSQPLNQSLAILFEPHTIDDRSLAIRAASSLPYLGWKGSPPNALRILQNGLPDTLVVDGLPLKKINGVFPPYATHMSVRIVHDAGEEKLTVYCQGTYHSIFPISVSKHLPATEQAWMGFTASGGDWRVHSVTLRHINPEHPSTRVFWPKSKSPKPHEQSTFFMELRDACDRRLAGLHGPLKVQLRLIDSHQPRAVVQVNNDQPPPYPRPYYPPSSLLHNPLDYRVACSVEYMHSEKLYKINFSAGRPGRYSIHIWDAVDAVWHKVKWHTVHVRHYW